MPASPASGGPRRRRQRGQPINHGATTMQLPENIHADTLPAIGADLAGGKLVTLYMLAGAEFALIDLGAGAEINGAWGEYGQEVETTHGDGEKNTRAMAEAGSTIAIQAM